jgi:adenylate cyclase class IV
LSFTQPFAFVMREVELKSLVPDLALARRRVEAAGGVLAYAGRLEDRRYDTRDRQLAGRDHVLRVRVYRGPAGARALLDWKGRTEYERGYKVREELSTGVADADVLVEMLDRLGYVVTQEIDRWVAQYDLGGTAVRFECYPRMDTLVEVEGVPQGIEAAIEVLGLPRAGFTADRLPAFVARFEARTGQRAALSDRELRGEFPYRVDDA